MFKSSEGLVVGVECWWSMVKECCGGIVKSGWTRGRTWTVEVEVVQARLPWRSYITLVVSSEAGVLEV